jgi:hypothetical protein
MLQIKKSFSLSLPSFSSSGSKQMELSPVCADDDELTQDLIADPDMHDNNWELNDRPDEHELEAFWTGVEQDVKKDPTWFAFDNE